MSQYKVERCKGCTHQFNVEAPYLFLQNGNIFCGSHTSGGITPLDKTDVLEVLSCNATDCRTNTTGRYPFPVTVRVRGA